MLNGRRSTFDFYSAGKSYQSISDAGMQFPQTSVENVRQFKAVDIEQMTQSLLSNHRRYVQLKPGNLRANLTEINLDRAILVSEELNSAVQIEAGPPTSFIPVGRLLCNPELTRFCDTRLRENSLLQASGGEWSLYGKQSIHYIGCIIEKSALSYATESLITKEMPAHWLASQPKEVPLPLVNSFTHWMKEKINLLEQTPSLLQNNKVRHQLSSELIYIVTTLLSSNDVSDISSRTSYSPTRRQRGVRRVIEYLACHARDLPSVPELCVIAQLSERSLEYGFREQLGVTPLKYLNLVRLNGVRHDLFYSDPSTTHVSDVAMHWGFLELGRFSGVYKQLFNELPSKTLLREQGHGI